MIGVLRWVGGKLADLLFGPEGDCYVSRTTLEAQRPMSVSELVRSQVRDDAEALLCMSCGGNDGYGPAPHHTPDCYFASWEDAGEVPRSV